MSTQKDELLYSIVTYLQSISKGDDTQLKAVKKAYFQLVSVLLFKMYFLC